MIMMVMKTLLKYYTDRILLIHLTFLLMTIKMSYLQLMSHSLIQILKTQILMETELTIKKISSQQIQPTVVT